MGGFSQMGMFNPLMMMGGKGMFPGMGGMFPGMPWNFPGMPPDGGGFPGGKGGGGGGKRRGGFSRSRSRRRSRSRSGGKNTDYMTLPRSIMGRVIGKAGATINKIREESGARIDAEDQSDNQCEFKISGTPEAIEKARRLIQEVASKASEPGGGGGGGGCGGCGGGGRSSDDPAPGDGPSEHMEFPISVMGGIIGARGAKIMEVRKNSGARVQVEKHDERTCRVQIQGSPEQIEQARAMVQKLADEDHSVQPPLPTDSGDVESESMQFPLSATGRIIGSRGASVAEVRAQSGARVSVEKGEDCCRVHISGTPSQVRRAKQMVTSLAEEGEGSGGGAGGCRGGGGMGGRRGDAEDAMDVPQSLVGRVIGKGGETIQRLQKESGARIDVNTGSGDPCVVRFTGTRDAVSRARFLVGEVLDRWSGGGPGCGGAGPCGGPPPGWGPPGVDPGGCWGPGPPGFGGCPMPGMPGFGGSWGPPPAGDGTPWQASWPMGPMHGMPGSSGGGGDDGFDRDRGRDERGGCSGGDTAAAAAARAGLASQDIDLDEL